MDCIFKTPVHWDWETLALFSEKDCEISKPSEESAWKFERDVDVISNGSGCSSGGGTCSGSHLSNSPSKSSVSASIDCSAKAERRAPESKFDSTENVPGNMNKINGLSQVEDTSVRISAEDPKEPIIGLKLGKKTYFEDSSAGNNMKSSSTMTSIPTSASSAKKPKASQQKLQIYCQVEGCKTDLSKSKEYHRKHRVCMIHSKSPKVMVSGQERRFCQQCSRFHGLSEFDQKKRSCRRRLSDHNARRRKPQPETISFNSSLVSAPYYDDKHQMNLVFGRAHFGHVNTATSATWDFSGDFKLRQFKDIKSESINAEHHFLPTALPHNTSTALRAFDGLLPYKGTTAEVFHQGLESPVGASSFEGAQDAQRALSLLSTESFGSAYFGPVSTVQFVDANISSSTHPALHTMDIPSGFWQDQQHPVKELPFNLHDDSFQFQDFQLRKPVHEDFFFDSSQIH